jgi:hypothetical protein
VWVFLVGSSDETGAEGNTLLSSGCSILHFPPSPFSKCCGLYPHSWHTASSSKHRTLPIVSSPWTLLHWKFTWLVNNGTSETLLLTLMNLLSTHLNLSYYCFFALIHLFACLLPFFLPITMDNDFTERAYLFSVYCVPSAFQKC